MSRRTSLTHNLKITLTTDGEDIFVHTDRPLKDNEFPVLLRCGRSHRKFKRYEKPFVGIYNGEKINIYDTYGRLGPLKDHKWNPYIVNMQSAFTLEYGTNRLIINKDALDNKLLKLPQWREDSTFSGDEVVLIRKAKNSYPIYPNIEGKNYKCCFGIAIYKFPYNKKVSKNYYRPWSRISNVCYYTLNVECLQNQKIKQYKVIV